jgi:hypothetical protein
VLTTTPFSVQLTNVKHEAGTALTVTLEAQVTVPPPLAAPPPELPVVMAYVQGTEAKLATKFRLALAVKV